MASKAEMDQLWLTIRRIGTPLLVALAIGAAGLLFALRDDLHAQDVRLVALEKTAPTMETIEKRFLAILVEMQTIKGDLRVIRTEMQAMVQKLCDLEKRVSDLEKREHGGK